MKTLSRFSSTAITSLALATLAGCVGEPTAPVRDAASAPDASTPAAAIGADQATQQVVASGTGWRVLHLSGAAPAANGITRMVNEDILVADSLAALEEAPISALAKSEVKSSFARLPASEQRGPIIVSMAAAQQLKAAPATARWPECEIGTSKWSETFTTRKNVSYTQYSVPGSFVGAAAFAGSASPTVSASATFNIFHTGVWPLCVPIAATVKSLRLSGGVNVSGSADIKGAFQKEWRTSLTIISPQIYAGVVFISVFPVLVTVEIPIDVGIDGNAKVKFDGKATAEAHGDFDMTCVSGKCSTTRNTATTTRWTNNRLPTFDARATISPWVQGSVKLALYLGVVSGQVGLRTTLKNDVWSYSGNTCGDANNDGTPEQVQARTLDARLGLNLVASAAFVGVKVGNWSWRVRDDYFVGFYDLIGSTAMDPMFYVAGASGTSYSFKGRMRPCWPYAQTMTYGIAWGDGSSLADMGYAPSTLFAREHVFPKVGVTYQVKLTAMKDAAGRVLNRSVIVPIRASAR